MTFDDLVVSVQNGRQGSAFCSQLCCSLLVLHEVNGTFLLPELFCMEMVLPFLGGCEVKLMFIKKNKKIVDNAYGPIFHSDIFRKKVF